MADIIIEIAGLPVKLSERDIARFWSKVDRSDPGGCWPWIGSTNGKGRGVMLLAKRPVYAPQLSLVIAGNPRPPKPCNNALHGDDCVSALCVRPDHLRWGTHKEKHRRRCAPGAVGAGQEVEADPRAGKFRARIAHDERSRGP